MALDGSFRRRAMPKRFCMNNWVRIVALCGWGAVAALISCYQEPKVQHDCSGAWIPKTIPWVVQDFSEPEQDMSKEVPVSHFDSGKVYMSDMAPVLVFGPTGKFIEDYSLVYGWSEAETLCLSPEGGMDFAGEWHYSGQSVVARYRLIDRVVRMVGESLPGPWVTDTLAVIELPDGTIELACKSDTFVRHDKFCERDSRFLRHHPAK